MNTCRMDASQELALLVGTKLDIAGTMQQTIQHVSKHYTIVASCQVRELSETKGASEWPGMDSQC
jgi:hypothetical protein